MGNLDPFHWALIAIGLLVVFKILRGLKNSSSNLMPGQLPEPIRQEVEATLPGFMMETARSMFKRKFIIRGTYKGRQGKVDIELNSKDRVDEFEYEEYHKGPYSKTFRSCDASEVPAVANNLIGEFLGENLQQFEPYRTSRGTVKGETVYKVKGRTPGLKWEFEISETGRLVELERERSR